ncbi:MAG: pyridoxine 5'-phosphate synthase [Candidatus Latescibacteria bacterium]|nr:pyridoxine 5'-phosphate synthase [Candidatus Latescibacterota bacterium]NIM22615.1 pyridoxine 5'-phosphate synthase [Candidatus Latescibacterota bacterium]NIM64904.1 pyridoxine 5'-phosphate synthase [Candidatus Latescibacterota bacterium]NIO01419.1 pyridoxine 5'-phosphate synthase [Candidatus Latescibacterota bacterium]NIO27929.1 pyridoxine 5'-phosphate synthase [Candidatus Latescibacterota bacterium]
MVRLGVNIDHVATVRQARRTVEPDPLSAAVVAEMAGADQITIHLREDRRHIQNRDARLIREVVKTALNLEMAATPEMHEIALALHPDSVTLVPEKREEVTTEGGLDLKSVGPGIGDLIVTLKDAGIKLCAFLDPDLEQIKEAAHLKFQAVEIHTGQYANATAATRESELEKIKETASAIRHFGMAAHAGHGLDYHNVTAVAQVPEIEELNIGHAIIARALFIGLEQAVRDMLKQMGRL